LFNWKIRSITDINNKTYKRNLWRCICNGNTF